MIIELEILLYMNPIYFSNFMYNYSPLLKPQYTIQPANLYNCNIVIHSTQTLVMPKYSSLHSLIITISIYASLYILTCITLYPPNPPPHPHPAPVLQWIQGSLYRTLNNSQLNFYGLLPTVSHLYYLCMPNYRSRVHLQIQYLGIYYLFIYLI